MRAGRPSLTRPLAVVLSLAFLIAGCSRSGGGDSSSTSAWVVEKVMPAGKLVVAGTEDGSIKQKQFPADIVPADALTDVEGVRCDVAAFDLPAGTILRRGSFVAPAKLGLDKGLTTGTGDTGC